MLKNFVKKIPEELKSKSGAVFYSGRSAFSGTKKVYILGLNPGGREEYHKEFTIEKQVQEVVNQKDTLWSAYFEENWANADNQTPFQKRIQKLYNALDLDAREVPASNICFVRSRNKKVLGSLLYTYADQCWSFHQTVMDQLGVQMIVCLGKDTGNYVRSKLDAIQLKEHTYTEQNNRGWKTEFYKNQEGIIVVSATHPSRADWTNLNSSPIPKIKEIFERKLKL